MFGTDQLYEVHQKFDKLLTILYLAFIFFFTLLSKPKQKISYHISVNYKKAR